MAGLIRREDIDAVRERADLREVVEQFVTLKKAGIGSWKGLCPFHDERSPSFHIRPQVGTYHCFGCGESGDVIAFLQSQEHTSFQETVEQLAHKYGIELRYEDGGTRSDQHETSRRQRLLDAHKIAAEFYIYHLQSPEAEIGRNFLTERGFTRENAEYFSIGYAPKGWDALLKRLRGAGFNHEELTATGLFSKGSRGLYDRFRGRLMWPISDMTGATIGFGGRRLHSDDKGPKYLNSPETAIYKKSQVLYGIHYAKRSIAKKRQLVIVEGYTDVMACHIAGVDTAVATCGTAFGEEHSKITRRLLSDDGEPADVIFTFDGDEAGQNAALKAFKGDHHFTAQTYIALGPEGMDPCDIRQQRGDTAVVDLINQKMPLFEFVIRNQLAKWDLDAVEGRVGALNATAPILAGIRDLTLRQAYSRELAGWLGIDITDVNQALENIHTSQSRNSRSRPQQSDRARTRATEAGGPPSQSPDDLSPGTYSRNNYSESNYSSERSGDDTLGGSGHWRNGDDTTAAAADSQANSPRFPRPDTSNPGILLERQALEVVLQHPTRLDAQQWQEFFSVVFVAPAHQAIHQGIREAAAAVQDPRQWVTATTERVPEQLRSLVAELAVTSLPASTEHHLLRYCQEIMNKLVEHKIQQQKSTLMGRLQRMDPRASQETYHQLNTELMELEARRRALKRVD